MIVKIFQENNQGPQELEDRINDFFNDKEKLNVLSMNTCIEKVDGIGYMNIVICYDYI